MEIVKRTENTKKNKDITTYHMGYTDVKNLLLGKTFTLKGFGPHDEDLTVQYDGFTENKISKRTINNIMNASESDDSMVVSWNSVDDGFPESDDPVLVSTCDNNVCIAKWKDADTTWVLLEGNAKYAEGVVAWMPMIKPYKVTDSEAIRLIKGYVSDTKDIPARTRESFELAISRISAVKKLVKYLNLVCTDISSGEDVSERMETFNEVRDIFELILMDNSNDGTTEDEPDETDEVPF